MKASNSIFLGAALVSAMTFQLAAQEAEEAPKKKSLQAVVLEKGAKPAKGKNDKKPKKVAPKSIKLGDDENKSSIIIASEKPGKFTWKKNADEMEEQDFKKKYDVFYAITPKDLLEAQDRYSAGEFKDALTKLKNFRAQYAHWKGIPEGPYVRALRMELDAAVRSFNFARVKELTGEYKECKRLLSDQDQVNLDAALILADATAEGAKPEDVIAKVTELLKKKDVNKVAKKTDEADAKKATYTVTPSAVTPHTYGWLHYAIGRAYENGITVEPGKPLASEQLAAADKAIDAYCIAGISSHGSKLEIPVDAMIRAQNLLWAMPEVQSAVPGMRKLMSDKPAQYPKDFVKSPQNFQDAVGLAYMLIHVYGVEADKNPSIKDAAALFVNTHKGKAKAKDAK